MRYQLLRVWRELNCRARGHVRLKKFKVVDQPIRRVDDVWVDDERFDAYEHGPAMLTRNCEYRLECCARCGKKLT